VFEGIPDADENGALDIVTFDEADGVTTMTLLVQFQNTEARDGMLESGMESGMQIGYDRMEDLLHEMQ
jgi:uncharacterized protein YndB with AHSA1/START domain